MVLRLEVPDTHRPAQGWYCNIAAPPLVEGSKIATKDLIVDVFVWPDRSHRVLDMAELEERKSALQPSLVKRVHEAREKIVRMIERSESPFDE